MYDFNLKNGGADYYDLGEYLSCLLGNMWGILRIGLAGVVIILMTMLILKTVQNRENSKVLPEIGKNWILLGLLIIVSIGGGGTALNILFGFLRLPDVKWWLDIVNNLFRSL